MLKSQLWGWLFLWLPLNEIAAGLTLADGAEDVIDFATVWTFDNMRRLLVVFGCFLAGVVVFLFDFVAIAWEGFIVLGF